MVTASYLYIFAVGALSGLVESSGTSPNAAGSELDLIISKLRFGGENFCAVYIHTNPSTTTVMETVTVFNTITSLTTFTADAKTIIAAITTTLHQAAKRGKISDFLSLGKKYSPSLVSKACSAVAPVTITETESTTTTQSTTVVKTSTVDPMTTIPTTITNTIAPSTSKTSTTSTTATTATTSTTTSKTTSTASTTCITSTTSATSINSTTSATSAISSASTASKTSATSTSSTTSTIPTTSTTFATSTTFTTLTTSTSSASSSGSGCVFTPTPIPPILPLTSAVDVYDGNTYPYDPSNNGGVFDWQVDLPFAIGAYGNFSNSVLVNINGYFTQPTGVSAGEINDLSFPYVPMPILIAPYAGTGNIIDLGQHIRYNVSGEASNRQVAFEFSISGTSVQNDYYRFATVFYESCPGIIDNFYYVITDTGRYGTVGVQNLNFDFSYLVKETQKSGSIMPDTSLRMDTLNNALIPGTFKTPP